MQKEIAELQKQVEKLTSSAQGPVQTQSQPQSQPEVINTGTLNLEHVSYFHSPNVYIIGSPSCGVTRMVIENWAKAQDILHPAQVIFVRGTTETLSSAFTENLKMKNIQVTSSIFAQDYICLTQMLSERPAFPNFILQEGTTLTYIGGIAVDADNKPDFLVLRYAGIFAGSSQITEMPEPYKKVLLDFLQTIEENKPGNFYEKYCK
jgi:hypothetical protein